MAATYPGCAFATLGFDARPVPGPRRQRPSVLRVCNPAGLTLIRPPSRRLRYGNCRTWMRVRGSGIEARVETSNERGEPYHAKRFGAYHFGLDGDGRGAEVPAARRGRQALRHLRDRRPGSPGLTTAYLLAREGKPRGRPLDAAPSAGARPGGPRAPGYALDMTATSCWSGSTANARARLAAESHAAGPRPDRGDRPRRGDRLRLRATRRVSVPTPGPSRMAASSTASSRRRATARGSLTEMVPRAPDLGVRHRPEPAGSRGRQAAVPPLEIPGRARDGDRPAGRADPYGLARRSGRRRQPCATVTSPAGGVVTAGSVVVATNVPFNDRGDDPLRSRPYRSYVVGARVPNGTVFSALYWDTPDPYHYVRLQRASARRTAQATTTS